MMKIFRMTISSVRRYTKEEVGHDGKTYRVDKAVAKLTYDTPDWDNIDKEISIQRFVDAGSAEYALYRSNNVGHKVELMCSACTKASGSGYFMEVEAIRLVDDSLPWVAPCDMTAIESANEEF